MIVFPPYASNPRKPANRTATSRSHRGQAYVGNGLGPVLPLTALNLDAFTQQGSFILRKLSEHDPIRFKTVMDDLYRDEPPDPMDITKFEWGIILAYLGASPEEIGDMQKRMGRVWR